MTQREIVTKEEFEKILGEGTEDPMDNTDDVESKQDDDNSFDEDVKYEIDDKINIWRKDKTKRQDKEKYYNNLDMKNPYRKESSLDISKTMKSYRWIETDLLLKLIQSKISSSEWSIFMYILHRTRGYCNSKGFYRHLDSIPIKLFEKSTGLKKPTIYRSIKSLMKKHMIYEVEEDTSRGVYVFHGINYRYDTWISKDDE